MVKHRVNNVFIYIILIMFYLKIMPDNNVENPDMRGAPWRSWSDLLETWILGWYMKCKDSCFWYEIPCALQVCLPVVYQNPLRAVHVGSQGKGFAFKVRVVLFRQEWLVWSCLPTVFYWKGIHFFYGWN